MPTYSSSTHSLDLDLRDTWGTGLVADLTLIPEQSLTGWTVTFDYPGDIVNIWNARIVSHVGDRYVVESVGYNNTVAAGGSVNFGFQGSGSVHDITPVALVGEPIGDSGDTPPSPIVSVSDASASEEAGSIEFVVSLSAPAATDVEVTYQTMAGTAEAGTDYSQRTATVTIPAGQTSSIVTIALINDAISETSESFSLELLSAVGADIGDGTATGTITDTDIGAPDAIEVTVTGGSVTEADPGMAHMHDDGTSHMHDDGHRYITFMVALEGPAAEALSLTYETADGTAVADTTNTDAWDYHETTGTVTFAVGEQMKMITVAVHPDLLVEETETFTFTVSGDNITGTLSAIGSIYDNDTAASDDDSGEDGRPGGGDSSGFVGGGTTYAVGSVQAVSDFDPARDILDLGGSSIHNQIPVDTAEGFMMVNMFNSGQSLLVEGVWLEDLHPENFTPISDAHLQQDLSAILAYEDGSGFVRPNTIYVRSHQEGLVETVDFDPATDKISFFYLSVRGDGELNFSVEQTAQGVRFFSPITGQSLTLRNITFDDLNSNHFEWRANQLEDNVAGRMNLSGQIDGFQIITDNVFSGKSVAMAGGVDRAPYHSVQGYEEYSGTPIGATDNDTGGGGDSGGDDMGTTPVTVTVTGGSVTEADPGMAHMHEDGASHMHDDGHRYITFQIALDAPAAEALTLNYATADGTAIADTTSDVAWDYHTATGTVTFAVGEQLKTVAVAVHPDELVEDTETFSFTVSGDNIIGTLEATGTIYDDDTADDDGSGGDGGGTDGGGDTGTGPFVGGGTTYQIGTQPIINGFDPTRDVLDLGGDSIHNQIPVDTPDGFMMLHMFNTSKSTLVEGVSLADLSPENFAPIADSHLQQDLSAALAWDDGSGLVRPDTVYVRSHQQGLEQIVDFEPVTDKISFFYLSVRGDGELNFSVEQTDAGVRFFSTLTGQSLTLRDITFDDLNSNHFEWRANQLEDNVAGRMNLSGQIDGFQIVSENVFSGKSVAMAGGVDRAPYHSQPDYSGTPIGQVGDPSNPDTVVPDPVDESGGGSSGGSGGSSGGSGGGSNVAATSGLVAPEIVASWGGGYNVETAFTPDVSVNGWTVQLRLSGEIVNIWNAEIAAQDGDIYTFVSLGYNASLAAGQTTGFGFQVSGGPA
ncbi:MAG: Calx-beta domain-containing protein, partial [Pseudomonadota bacterium]